MKIGYSSLVCPDWDLDTIVAKAGELGFEAVELRGLQGRLHLPAVPALAANPEATRAMFAEAGVELACLGTSASFTSRRPREVADRQAEVRETIELAAALGCPFVRVFAGEVPEGSDRHSTQARVAQALRELAPFAASYRVELLVENQGDYSRSKDIWYLLDATSHPAIGCCWNPVHALMVGERPTISIPRLGTRISMVHVCDARLAGPGALDSFVEPGQGEAQIPRLIGLLRGVGFRGGLIFEWPKLWISSLPEPEAVLPKVREYISKLVSTKDEVLSAYKGDKNAPKLAPPPPTPKAAAS